MVLALTFRSFTSTLLPVRTMGMFSHTRTRSPEVHISWIARNQYPKALTVPVGNVLVGNPRGHIEHDDAALAVDIVTISQSSELLLAGSIPDVEYNRTKVLVNLSAFCVSVPQGRRKLTVLNPRGWTSTPRVAMYFFSNSPVKWRLTKVV